MSSSSSLVAAKNKGYYQWVALHMHNPQASSGYHSKPHSRPPRWSACCIKYPGFCLPAGKQLRLPAVLISCGSPLHEGRPTNTCGDWTYSQLQLLLAWKSGVFFPPPNLDVYLWACWCNFQGWPYFLKMFKLSTVGQACCPNYSVGWGKDHLSLRVQDQLDQYGKILKRKGEWRKERGKGGGREKKKENREAKIESTTKGCK